MLPGNDVNSDRISDIDARLAEYGRRLYAAENTIAALEPKVTELQTALFGNQKIGMQSIPAQIAEIRRFLIVLGGMLAIIIAILLFIASR